MFKLSFLSLFFLVGCQTNSAVSANTENQIKPENSQKLEVVGQYYRNRYSLKNASQKLVNNNGNGFDSLYGVRNFRAVLNGVYYRGGANNLYNKNGKRDNMNPLPTEGLVNLCKEGFSQSIYLYTTNFNTAPKINDCRTIKDGADNRLEYLQHSSLSDNSENIHRILTLVHEHIMNPSLGPIYAHCWNGWHASGFAAAASLRQFCGFNGEQAVKYWNLNTDGAYDGYDSIRKRIREFVPFAELKISDEIRRVICPDGNSLNFPSAQ